MLLKKRACIKNKQRKNQSFSKINLKVFQIKAKKNLNINNQIKYKIFNKVMIMKQIWIIISKSKRLKRYKSNLANQMKF